MMAYAWAVVPVSFTACCLWAAYETNEAMLGLVVCVPIWACFAAGRMSV